MASSTALTARQLLDLCERVHDSFNAAQHTLDSHLHEQLQQQQHSTSSRLTDDERCFVQEVCYGVLRYSRFLNAFLASFWDKNSGTALRSDGTKCRIYAYLAAFRLQELGWDTFRQLVCCQDAAKMQVLLSYLFDSSALQECCRQDWIKLYDKEFVDSTIAGLLAWREQSDALLGELREAVFFTQQQQQQDKESSSSSSRSRHRRQQHQQTAVTTTVPQPFNLTQPRPKPLPKPEPVPPAPKPKPPPKPREGPTREEAALEAARAANRAAIAARQADPRFGPFKLRVLERPNRTPSLQAAAEAALTAELARRPPKARAPPSPVSEVRLTAAAVLREHQLYKAKQAEEAAALQRYEAELRDTAAFDRWQQAARQQDAEAQQARVERLRHEMCTAAGAAAAAKAGLQAAKAAAGAALKQQRAALEAEQRQQQQQQQAANADKVLEVAAGRDKARQAQEAVLQDRRQAADAVRQQAEAEARQRAEAAAAEMAERKDLIAQLRGAEAAARRAASQGRLAHVFDPTATSDTAINEQMSLLELRERLAAVQERERAEEERRRERIQQQRAAREASIASKAQQLSSIRRLASAQASARKAAVTMQRAQTASAVLSRHEAGALALSDRLQQKHEAAAAEAARLAAEQKRVRFEQLQNAVGASAVEAARFRELREGSHRACEQRQQQRLADAAVDATNAARQAATRKHAQALQRHEHGARVQQYDSDLLAAVEQSDKASARLLAQRQTKAATQRQHEQRQRQTHRESMYNASSAGQSPVSSIQARLQALAAGGAEDDDCCGGS